MARTDIGIAALRTAQHGLLAPPPQLSRLNVGQRRALALLLRAALIDSPTDDRPR